MGLFDGIKFPHLNTQELNLDWIMTMIKELMGFMPTDGDVGDILMRKSDGASWEPPTAVQVDIDGLPEDTQIMNNDQLIFYDISVQANRKIKPPNLLDSMCSDAYPLMDGIAAAGTSKKPARYDHVHPTDTSRAPSSYFQNGNLKVGNGGTGADNGADACDNLGVGDYVYPVGSIYMSVNSTSPASLFGGTWQQLKDRFLLGAGDTYTAGDTGGEATHTLTASEMPQHNHELYTRYGVSTGSYDWSSPWISSGGTETNAAHTKNAGGGDAHNNMPPYLVVYMWVRTA